MFESSGYSRSQGIKAFSKAFKGLRDKSTQVDPIPRFNIPLIQGTSDRIVHVLRRKNVASSFIPLCTIKNSLRSVKDPIDPKDMKGVYLFPCSCGTGYIGETSRSIRQRIHEHAIDIRHSRSHTSALAKHVGKSCHHVCIEDSKVLSWVDHFHHRKLREAIEIERHPKNLNRDDGWKLSRSWIVTLSR